MNERVAAKPKQASPKTQPPARSGASSVRTGTGALPPVVHEVLRSPGQPLDPATRAFAEPRFGHDFGRVRVHDDVRSAEAARQLDSVAFTSGQHVFFGTGAYRPETPTGRRLLAHELAHTLQQREAQPSVGNPVIQSNPIVSRPGDRLEREAEAAAERVAAGGRLAPGSISPAGTRALISRQVATLAAREPAGTRLEAEELVEDLAQTILGDLRRDPGDVSGSTHRRLNRLDPSTREAVLERIESLATPDQSMRLAQILAAPAPPEVETPQETEEAYRPEPEDRAPLPEPAPEAVPETSRPETEEIRPGVSPEPETAPPAGVAGVATTGEMGAAPPVAIPVQPRLRPVPHRCRPRRTRATRNPPQRRPRRSRQPRPRPKCRNWGRAMFLSPKYRRSSGRDSRRGRRGSSGGRRARSNRGSGRCRTAADLGGRNP